MGLHIHTLNSLPENVHRDYYVYLLDYGGKEDLGAALKNNFERMSKLAEKSNAIVIAGTDEHFQDEVFSWHNINGENGEQLLPAILITNRHPLTFKKNNKIFQNHSILVEVEENLGFILIPLRKCCKTTSEVVDLIEGVFKDIQDKKSLSNFEIEREMKKGFGNAVANGIVLKPNFMGLGYDFNSWVDFFKKK